MVRFILGVVVGGLAVWFWGDQIREFAESKATSVRTGAVDTLQAVEKKAEAVLDRAKEQVGSALQAGQDVVRPLTLRSTPGRSAP